MKRLVLLLASTVLLATVTAMPVYAANTKAAGSGDTDSLMAAMKAMTESLARIVGQVRLSSDSIATGSEQIATGNLDLSQRTALQASPWSFCPACDRDETAVGD